MTREPESDTETERRNFISTTIYQVLLRIGWIFKTESVIIPAALDSIGGSGVARGFLPMLNRIGQSLPPLLLWPLISGAKRQTRWLFATTMMMGLLFCLLALLWITGYSASGIAARRWFLTGYCFFFVATGLNQLTLSSLIGKLIPAEKRGKLMLAANGFGCIGSVVCAWFVLRLWLQEGNANFAAIFGTSGLMFIVAALSIVLIREPDSVEPVRMSWRLQRIIGDVWQTVSLDRHFRIVVIISGLFGLGITLMPHYQSLARTRLNLGYFDLLGWLIIQNIGVAVFSFPIGSLADRFGNRAALRVVISFLLVAPMMALLFANQPAIGEIGFMMVFFILGLTPVTMRLLANFSLEFTSIENQPKYLATQTIAIAVPVIASSALVGWLIDRWGFESVFLLITICTIPAWILTFLVHEPRIHMKSGDSA